MSKSSTTKTLAVSGDIGLSLQKVADVNKERPDGYGHSQSDEKHTHVYEYGTKSLKSNGLDFETSEHPCCFAEIETLPETIEEEEGKKEERDEEENVVEYLEDSEEDIQQDSENEGNGFDRLYLAANNGNEKTARSLLMSSADVSALDPNKNSHLQLYAIINELLYKKASANLKNAFDATSPQLALENGHVGITHDLLENNAANSRNESSHTPIPIAPEMGCVEIVKALIDYFGGINAVDLNGETALHLAARNDRNALEKILLNHSAEKESRSCLKLMVDQVRPVELEISQQSDRNEVHYAAQSGNFKITETPLSRNTSVKSDSTGQATKIHGGLATGREHAEIIENLILNGANVNARNTKKTTPLQFACLYGHSSIVGILLDNHATVDGIEQAQKTPFHLAAKYGHADVVDVFLRRGMSDFVLTSYDGTPLHVAVDECHLDVVEVILKYNCRISGELTTEEQKLQENVKNFVETRDIMPIELVKADGRRFSAGIVWIERCTPLETMLVSGGCTALEYAVRSTQPKMVKMLLSAERCVYSEKHLGYSFRRMMETSLDLPGQRYEDMSKIKNRKTIDIMEFKCSDIQYKMKCRNIKEIAQLLMNSNKFNTEYKNEKLNTPLHEVIKQCICDFLTKNSKPWRLTTKTTNDVIQLLLEKGADFNVRNAFGETPLIIASENGCCHIIKKLLDWEQKSELKLDLDARDEYGATALIKAAETHHVSVIRLLLRHKVSVNLQDYYGFTALHAAVYEPNRHWFDLHFFCNELRERKYDYTHEISRRGQPSLTEQTFDPFTENSRLQKNLEHDEKTKLILFDTLEELEKNLEHEEKTTRYKEEMARSLLAINEVNVNAIDFRGNTPLDLVVKSSRRINSKTFKEFEKHGAFHNSQEPIVDAPLEVARVDERGRGPLHRMIISHVSNCADEEMNATQILAGPQIFDPVVHAILLKPENFRHLATATDDKGRTPLHYAAMPASYNRDLMEVLVDIGSSVNAVDMYRKTPLHYAEIIFQYEFLVKYGADESVIDNYVHTPKDLKKLRELVAINIDNAKKLPIGKKKLHTSRDNKCALKINHVTEFSKRKLVQTIRIRSQSRRSVDSSENSIWKVWNQSNILSLNMRLNKLKPSIQRFVDRLADGIKGKDGRFQCQPILVGSACEETKAVISADFDFNFKLVKFSQLCDVFPHPLGPNGYFQLRLKSDNATKSQIAGKFDCFFNLDKCLLTSEVNSRFQITLDNVLHNPTFWQDEYLFECSLTDIGLRLEQMKSEKPVGMCKTVRLRMIHPIQDGEGGFLLVNVSIDIVACVHVEDSCFEDRLPADMNTAGKADGYTMVFDRPRFDPSKPGDIRSVFSDTFARISFAQLESRIIREGSSLAKAAYTVCKLILFNHSKTTYQLKTALFFCMEALKIPEGYQRKDDNSFTPKELAFWVERLMFCFSEFYQHDVYPCYFMPSFKQQVVELRDDTIYMNIEANNVDTSLMSKVPFRYSPAFDIYLDLCPDEMMIDIPIMQNYRTYDLNEGSLIVTNDPQWEHFDREEFIRKLASRCPSN